MGNSATSANLASWISLWQKRPYKTLLSEKWTKKGMMSMSIVGDIDNTQPPAADAVGARGPADVCLRRRGRGEVA